ncbi:serine protease [Myxococcus sp. K15C18031901]|uniref:trypsin-like serine peptidase n=1 Tax=Myxococcus dinghuensis TaxID=2906761 RepID=UPI0020A7ACBC|nr:trypsin-like peptidase domain-containing protein [Myxococcus dinghuensis]MCP3097318.1 serine protease [Myxococcus dinghuensis]
MPHESVLTSWGARLAGTALLVLVACGEDAVPPAPQVCEEPELPEVSGQAQCGPTLEFTPVNRYTGLFADVVDREDAVVFIDGRCTGTLIEASAGPVVLTAGHCVGLGDRSVLVFNFEEDPDGDELVTEGTVIERSESPDYALIAPDTLPAVTPTLLSTVPTERLAIIQHPRGHPKVIAEGRFLDSCNQRLYYTDLDTLVSSSGAGVLNRQGYVVGIHTDGDCSTDGGGANRGWTTRSIVDASEYLVDEDIVER